eukprot:148701_1
MPSDIHNEFSSKKHESRNDVQKKCNHCGKVMNRNISTLVNHINNICTKAANKYCKDGSLMDCRRTKNPCHWSTYTRHNTHKPTNHDDEHLQEMEMDILLSESNRNTEDVTRKEKYSAKKRKLNLISAKNRAELETMYGTKSIDTYMKGPTPMTNEEKHNAHMAFTRLFTVCDIPFHIVSHPLFEAACHSIRPQYNPISETCMKERYVKELDREDDQFLQDELDGKKIFVSADASENGTKESVMHVLATGEFGTRVLDIIYHKPGKIGADTIHLDILKTRDQFFEKHGVDIEYGAYLHDNEITEKSVAASFVESEGRGECGCGPHGFNKFNNYVFLDEEYEAFMKRISHFISKINKGRIRAFLVRNIRRRRIELRLLKNDKTKRLQFNLGALKAQVDKKLETNEESVGFPDPGTTRQWSNMIKTIEFMIDNQNEIRMLDDEKEAAPYLHEFARAVIRDDDIWPECVTKHDMLSPVNESLVKLQNARCNLSNVYYEFHVRLKAVYVEDALFTHALLKAWKLIESNMHFASISTDPRFMGTIHLDLDDLSKAESYFKLVLGDVVWSNSKQLFYDFRAGIGAFTHSVFVDCSKEMNKERAVSGWRIVLSSLRKAKEDRIKLHQSLFVQEVVFLLKSPTGITDLEKSFCYLRRSHSWDRASLSKSLLSSMNKYAINWRMRNKLH